MNRYLAVLILLAGCSAPQPQYPALTNPTTASKSTKAAVHQESSPETWGRRQAISRALADHRAAEARERLRSDTVHQMRESRTNHPPFKP